MPVEKKQFNGLKAARRCVGNFFAFATLPLAFLGFLGSGLYAIVDADKKGQAYSADFNLVKSWQTANIDGTPYMLLNAHQIKLEQTGAAYFVDFNTRRVSVDGPDQADRVESFKAFDDSEFIEQTHQAGCRISTAVLENAEEASALITAWHDRDEERGSILEKNYQELRDSAAVFGQKYCAPEA